MSRIDVRTLLEHVLERDLPDVEGCRHVLITGATAAGKSTMLRRIVDGLGDDVLKRMVTSSSEMHDLAGTMASVGAMAPLHGDVEVEYALRHPADVLVVDDTGFSAARAVFEAMCDDVPMIVTTQTDGGPQDADLAHMLTASAGRGEREPRVAIVRMMRDHEGRRVVAGVDPI